MTRSGDRVTWPARSERSERSKRTYVYYVHYVPHVAKGFLRRTVMYLKDYSSYPDSSLFVVNLRI